MLIDDNIRELFSLTQEQATALETYFSVPAEKRGALLKAMLDQGLLTSTLIERMRAFVVLSARQEAEND